MEGESVYDWIEYTLADGGTLGIARDVTELLPAPEPDPAYSAVPPQMDAVAEYIAPPQAPVSAPPAYTPAQAMDIPAETASAPTMATQAFAPSRNLRPQPMKRLKSQWFSQSLRQKPRPSQSLKP